ncbi:hypothetical protein JD276_13890 [Leucobacter sp. CSA1]|uniref:HTH luxR-type domain-containing protein n=1 Tax=Leucobacter chromiisoli TaxID=2796471 RepID=A0A934UV22_9MICO|nr:LuxR C-terminal-related transcriptional regulator [Leucobacter chromiisoli]MBK0420124.1 hypothetical protein [Leucobacter chromiisoli]
MHAPAGYGKTAALVQWLSSEEAPPARPAWVRAPERRDAAGGLWERVHDALIEAAGAIDERSAPAARSDVERLVSGLREPVLLVIDDYQHATDAETDLAVAGLLELSGRLSIVVSSRRFAAIDGPLVTSRIRTGTVSAAQLRFTEQESRDLAALYGIEDLDQASSAQRMADGWPLAVQTMLEALSAGEGRDLPTRIARFAREHLELLSGDPARRAWLLSALCEAVDVDLVSEVAEVRPREGAAIMRELEELGLVSRRWYPEAVRFVCHPGLVAALAQRAEREFGPDRIRQIRRWHALGLGRDEPYEAFRLLCDLGDFVNAEHTLTRHFSALVGPEPGLLTALRLLPTEAVKPHPVIIGARLLLESTDPTTSPESLDHWYELLREATRRQLSSDEETVRIAALALLTAAERMRGAGAESLRLARDLEQRLGDEFDLQRNAVRSSLPLVHAVIALSGAVNGDLELARRNYTRVIRLGEAWNDPSEQIRGWNGLALTEVLAGDILAAERHLARADALGVESGRSAPHLSGLNGTAARAHIAHERQDDRMLRELTQRSDALVGRMEMWPLITLAEAEMVRVEQGEQPALQLIRRRIGQNERGMRAVPYLRYALAAYAASLTVFLGDLASAERQLERLPPSHPDVVVAWARLRLFAGDSGEARLLAAEVGTKTPTPRAAADALFIEAIADWQLGLEDDAFHALRAAAGRMSALGGRSYLTAVPYAALHELALAAREAGIVDVVDVVERVPEAERCVQFERLSPAELRTLEAIGAGITLEQAAERLFLSQNTVKFHLRSIYRKLRVSGREEAIWRGVRMGIISSQALQDLERGIASSTSKRVRRRTDS